MISSASSLVFTRMWRACTSLTGGSVGHLLVVAGADLGVGDLVGDIAPRSRRCAGRARARNSMRPLEVGVLSSLSALGLVGEQPDVDDRRQARRRGAGRRAAARIAGRGRSSASSRSASVIGSPSIVAITVSGAALRPALARGQAPEPARPRRGRRPASGTNAATCQHADELAAQQVGTHRRSPEGLDLHRNSAAQIGRLPATLRASLQR